MLHEAPMIYHLFNGSSWLLASQMIRAIVKYSDNKHYFVINPYHCDKNDYINLFMELDYHEYTFLASNKICRIVYYLRLIILGNFVRYKAIEQWLSLYDFLKKIKPQNLVIHSEIDRYAMILKDTNINLVWCCWGYIPSYDKDARLLRFRNSYYFKKFIENCIFIVALTEGDKYQLQKVYPSTKIVVASYSYIYDFKSFRPSVNNGTNILIGNSAIYIDIYRSLALKLQDIPGTNITFMCSYGVRSEVDYNQFKDDMIRMLSKNNVYFWEDNIPIDEYNKRIGNYDVFIAGMERQSGLGAITTALGSGLKVYLTGVNYSYFANRGLKVFHIEELENISKELLFNWPAEDMEKNIAKTKIVCGIKESIDKWEQIYNNVKSLVSITYN